MNKDKHVLQLITMLSDGNDWRIGDLAKELKTSQRTIYRTLEDIEACGYVINRNNGCPKIVEFNPAHEELGHMMNFTIEEQALLREMVLATDPYNPLRQSLLTKLQQVMGNADTVPNLTSSKSAEMKVRTINQSMQKQLQAVLIQYESGSSNTVQDRIVEPVAWSTNYRELHAFDLDKMAMRCFVLDRMKGVRLLNQPWQHKKEHVKPLIDCFWMSGDTAEGVTLEMTRYAMNLLHEEFPLSRNIKAKNSKHPERPYKITLPICKPQGCARFVMGLGRQIKVLEGDRLIKYIEQEKS